MHEGPNVARVAALIGDPARSSMLTALMSGMALTASELANEAGVALPTASGHLQKLSEGGLVTQRKQGRHRYFTLTDPDVALALEALMGLAARSGTLRTRVGPRDADLRQARVCYNHVAGDMGTRIFDSLTLRGLIDGPEDALTLTETGRAFMSTLGIDLAGLEARRSPLCRPCLDWSARRTHLAGSLGRALLARFEDNGWMRRRPNSRVLDISPEGQRQLLRHFPL